MTIKEFFAMPLYSQLYKIAHPKANHAKVCLAWYRHNKAEKKYPGTITAEYIAALERRAN